MGSIRSLAGSSVVAVIALAACSSNTTNKANGGGGTGTLFVNAETHSAVYSVDLGSGAATKIAFGADPFVTPDKTVLCKNTNTGDLGEYSADGTTFRTIVKKQDQAPFDVTYDDDFHNPQLSPDGRYVAYEGQLGYKFDVYVVDRQSGALVGGVNPPAVGVGYTRPTWTPDGRLVVAGGPNDVGLYLTDPKLKTFTRFDQGLANAAMPAVSPDGNLVAFILNDDLYTVKLDGSGLTELTQTNAKEAWPTWSPDGAQIAVYADSDLVLVPSAGGGGVDVHDRNDQFFTFSFTSDGQMSWR